jgi:protein-tyrosine phosphatase
MLTQVTAASVTGLMGRKAQKLTERLLADRWVHFVSTDAHNISNRPPHMRSACDHIAARYGGAFAQKLCTENPQVVFDNRPFPPQDPPLRIEGHSEYEEDDEMDEKPRGLLSRLFRR